MNDTPQRFSDFMGVEASFQDYVDIRYAPAADGSPQMLVDIDTRHINMGKVLHGGMVMTLLDVAMATMCRHHDALRRGAVTVELKVNFLRPCGKAGERVIATGRLRHATTHLAFCDGELRDSADMLLATASGTFKYVTRGKPQRGDS